MKKINLKMLVLSFVAMLAFSSCSVNNHRPPRHDRYDRYHRHHDDHDRGRYYRSY